MYLIFDIGGTFMRCAGVLEKKIIRKEKFPTPKTFEDGILMCKEMAEKVLQGETREGAVVGIAATLDRERRRIYRAPHLPSWNGKELARGLEQVLQVPVILRNDAELAGLGEAVYGAGREKGIVAYMTVGTGVGGTRIVNKKIDESTWGFEPGHQIISVDRKIQELSISGGSIKKNTGKDPLEIIDESFWKERSETFAVGIFNVILFWSPDVVVVGGSVSQKISLDVVNGYLEENLNMFAGIPDVIYSELGDDSGLWGGIVLVSALE